VQSVAMLRLVFKAFRFCFCYMRQLVCIAQLRRAAVALPAAAMYTHMMTNVQCKDSYVTQSVAALVLLLRCLHSVCRFAVIVRFPGTPYQRP
jgi:hypothetical protein